MDCGIFFIDKINLRGFWYKALIPTYSQEKNIVFLPELTKIKKNGLDIDELINIIESTYSINIDKKQIKFYAVRNKNYSSELKFCIFSHLNNNDLNNFFINVLNEFINNVPNIRKTKINEKIFNEFIEDDNNDEFESSDVSYEIDKNITDIIYECYDILPQNEIENILNIRERYKNILKIIFIEIDLIL